MAGYNIIEPTRDDLSESMEAGEAYHLTGMQVQSRPGNERIDI